LPSLRPMTGRENAAQRHLYRQAALERAQVEAALRTELTSAVADRRMPGWIVNAVGRSASLAAQDVQAWHDVVERFATTVAPAATPTSDHSSVDGW